jgi:hypothetical protein
VSRIAKLAALLLALAPCAAWGQVVERLPKPSQQNPGVLDVKDYGAVPGDGVDDTAAFNRALAAANGLKTVEAHGSYNIGDLTWVTAGNKMNHLRASGALILSATLNIPSFVHLEGIAGAEDSAFMMNSTVAISHPGGAGAAIRITGQQNHLVERVKINHSTGIGILIEGDNELTAQVRIRDCYVSSTGTAIAPIKVDSVFWVWIEGCCFGTSVAAAPASILLDKTAETISTGGYNGYIDIKDCIITGPGIQFLHSASDNTAGGYIRIYNCTFENLPVGGECVNVDINYSNITIDNCKIADPVGAAYYFNAPNGRVRNVTITDIDTVAPVLDPTSGSIANLEISGGPTTDYSTFRPQKLFPAWTQQYEIHTPGVRDVRLVQNYWTGGPTYLAGDVLPLNSDLTAWALGGGTATATHGVLGPDGAYNAVTLAPAVSNDQLEAPSFDLPSIAVGDWLIAGFWARGIDSTNRAQTGYFRTEAGSGITFNSGEPDYVVAEDSQQTVHVGDADILSDDGAWHFTTRAAKVTAIGADETPAIRFALKAHTAYGNTSFAYPFMMQIPSGMMSDTQVMTLARSMGSPPANGQMGDHAFIDHQRLRLGGGARLVSASAQPTVGTYEIGDRVLNNGPATGEAESWTCTVAGTQGTLVGTTADTTSGTPNVVVSAATGLQLNQYITIAGVTGIKKIIRISGTAVTIDSNASATVNDGAVAWSPATFVAGPTVGASQLKSISFVVTAVTADTATGDNQVYVHIPPALNGYTINYVHAAVATAGVTGTTDVQIARTRSGSTVDVLSTKCTIDSAETGSDTAATPAVINVSNDDLLTNDRLRVDVDDISDTPAKGLVVTVGASL